MQPISKRFALVANSRLALFSPNFSPLFSRSREESPRKWNEFVIARRTDGFHERHVAFVFVAPCVFSFTRESENVERFSVGEYIIGE